MRRSSSVEPLETLDIIMLQTAAGYCCCNTNCVAVGLEYRVHWCGDTSTPRIECTLACSYCMLQQHGAIGLQTDCMARVPAPLGEAAKLPRVYPMALGYELPHCCNNKEILRFVTDYPCMLAGLLMSMLDISTITPTSCEPLRCPPLVGIRLACFKCGG